MENMAFERWVNAFTATLPGRAGIAQSAIASIMPQCDNMQIVLNGFPSSVSGFPYDGGETIQIVRHDNSLQDGSRFIGMEDCPPGYVLVFDDDIRYPPDYVETLIEAHKKYGGIICPMGKILKPRPITSYYKDILLSLRTFDNVPADTPVQVPGMCGALWHNSEVKLSTKDMMIPNSDLCVAKYAKDNGIRSIVIKHSADWLTNLWTGEVTKQPSIYGKYRRNDEIQTDFVNMFL
jgi:hypothetical protein